MKLIFRFAACFFVLQMVLIQETSAFEENEPRTFPLGSDSMEQDGVPKGRLQKYHWKTSKVYPRSVRDYWVYVPKQYHPSKPAALMIFQDGEVFINPKRRFRATTVFDNLIAKGDMPVTIGVFVDYARYPDRVLPSEIENQPRQLEYDSMNDSYSRFLLEEIIPQVGARYNLSENPEMRAIGGWSSGASCAWTVAWHRPDVFRKVLSFIGSFTDIHGAHNYPSMIRRHPKKPIRIFLESGTDDLDAKFGNWALANQAMASALEFSGYDYKFDFAEGGQHDDQHAGQIFPDALRWLWRGWQLHQ